MSKKRIIVSQDGDRTFGQRSYRRENRACESVTRRRGRSAHPLHRFRRDVLSFRWPNAVSAVSVTVEAPGFPLYERCVNLESISGNEDFRLTQASAPPSNRTVKPVVESDTPAPGLHASILNPLPAIRGDHGPWAVILIGDHAERRDDVQSWVKSALSGGGHDTASLFKKVSDEQRVGVSLFRGGVGVLSGLDPGRYCSRILVGKLSVASLGSTEGLTIARATLAVHLLSPAGETQKAFELTEKGRRSQRGDRAG